MKKIIFILLSVFIISACYKTEIYKPELTLGFFHSECSIGDSLFYYMNCNVNYEYADIQFIRKNVKTIKEYHYFFNNTEYTIKKDTVITLMENYKYYGELFKYMLTDKNQENRDTTIFKITSNMYCTWECFDKMYNKYVKD